MENMKNYKKLLLITLLLTLLPILPGLLLWNQLPERIAIHWGADGQANGWAGKPFAVFALPCMLAALHLFCVLFTLADPKKRNIHKKPLLLVFWMMPVLSIVMCGITYAIALGMKIDVGIGASLLIGILFIILGNYMPKLRQNYTVGIRVPWTLNSEENWRRTHRLGGKLFIAGGFLLIITGFLGRMLGDFGVFAVLIAIALICSGIPAVYSFCLYKKGV